MIERLWHWLLDLDRVPANAEALRLGWERPFPAWGWVVAILALGLFAVWSYGGLVGDRRGRGVLAIVRFGILFLLVSLLAGPALVVPRELVERDWVVYLVDRSESMRIADASALGAAGAGSPRVARDAQLRETLEESAAVFESLPGEPRELWLGFDEGAYDLPLDEVTGLPALGGEPAGRRTALGPAIEQALARLAARPIRGIVIFSDGRTPAPPSRALLRRLQAQAVPIVSIPLGSSEPVGDLAVGQVLAPARAFAHDQVPIEVSIDRFGTFSAAALAGAEIVLSDANTGEVLDRQPVESASDVENAAESRAGSSQVTLLAKPGSAGPATWIVELQTRGGDGGGNDASIDLVEDNNSRRINLELVDRPLKVLYVEGYPRWEYRYLKNLLVRERTIDSSVMLLSADRDFAQEGNTPITRMPNSPEEFEPYDVIVIGDVHADYFSLPQQEMIRDHVAQRGAGLLFIGGPRSNPASYERSPLAALLPIRGSLALPEIGRPFTVAPTATAERLSVLQLRRGTQGAEDAWPLLSDPEQGWTNLQWGLRLDPHALKPAVDVLAETVDAFTADGEPLPLVTLMRFGSGQTSFDATDETWRWRYGQGELLPEQFWIQQIRMLGRDRLTLSGQPAALTVDPVRGQVGQPVVIELRVLDAQLVESAAREIPVELVDASDGSIIALTLTALPDAPGRYAATYLPDRAGRYEVRVAEAQLSRFGLSGTLEVVRPDHEMTRPESDHALLAAIAAETGGRVVAPDDLTQLPALLPNRSVRTPMDIVEPLWDTPLCFGLLALLLTAEWIGRKLLRLT